MLENKDISSADLAEVNSLKNNNKTDDHSVEVSEKGRWKHKQRLPARGSIPTFLRRSA